MMSPAPVAAGAAGASPSRRRGKEDFGSGRYDFLKLGRNPHVVNCLYDAGETGVEVSDAVACERAGDGEAALSLCVTPHTVYLFSENSWEVHTRLSIREIERVVFDPDGRTFSVTDAAAAVLLRVRCSEGSRRYHLHSQLRSLYHSEAYRPLPSLVGPCDLRLAERRRELLARVHAAAAQIKALSETDALAEQLQEANAAAARSQEEELRVLVKVAEATEAAAAREQARRPARGAHRPPSEVDAWAAHQFLEEKLKLMNERVAAAEGEAERMEGMLARMEGERSRLRAEMDKVQFGDKQNDFSQEVREVVHLATAEVLARKQIVSGYKLHLAGLALAMERDWSQLLVRGADRDLRALAAGVQEEQRQIAQSRQRRTPARNTPNPSVGWPAASPSPAKPIAPPTFTPSRDAGNPHGSPLSPTRPRQQVVIRHSVTMQELLAQSLQTSPYDGYASASPAMSSRSLRRSVSTGHTASPARPPSTATPDPRTAERRMREWRDRLSRHTDQRGRGEWWQGVGDT